MQINPWFVLALSVPVLLLGQGLVRRIPFLVRFNIPAPVVGGLLISMLVLVVNASGLATMTLETLVSDRWWGWIVTVQEEWEVKKSVSVNRPFLVAFFTCIGLNASWLIAKRGGWQVPLFLLVSSVLALIQSALGIAMARVLGVSELLGLVCGAVSMTGGHGTSAGFADSIAAAGLPEAGVLGAAAATFGLVLGGLVGGPVAGRLIRSRRLEASAQVLPEFAGSSRSQAGFMAEISGFLRFGAPALWHLLILLFCMKTGAWLSALIRESGISFPVYIGSMIAGVVLRNVLDFSGRSWIRTEVVEGLKGLVLAIFLAVALMTLQLDQLAQTALPMLIILSVQVLVMVLFAFLITFRVMGSGYDAAVMAGGHCGFGLGATPLAVGNMATLVARFGPSHRAFLVVPLVGGFLLDFTNAVVITVSLNLILVMT